MRGKTLLIILIVIFVILAGVLLFFLFGRDKIDLENLTLKKESDKIGQVTIDNIKISSPNISADIAPMKELNIDPLSFGLDVRSDIVGNISANTEVNASNFDYKLKRPVAEIVPSAPKISAGSGQSSPSSGTSPSSGADCQMFVGVPDCSYVGANYTALCRQCKGQ